MLTRLAFVRDDHFARKCDDGSAVLFLQAFSCFPNDWARSKNVRFGSEADTDRTRFKNRYDHLQQGSLCVEMH